MGYNLAKFRNQLVQFGLCATADMEHQLIRYYEILTEWNKVMNLTTITDFDEVLEKHFLDSVSIANYVEFSEIIRLIDVGTGAGFPGIPLKILYPHINVLLIDS